MNFLMSFLERILEKPLWVLGFSAVIFVVSFVFSGSLSDFILIKKRKSDIESEIIFLSKKKNTLKNKLKKISSPDYIESEAFRRLDFVGENDIVFQFEE